MAAPTLSTSGGTNMAFAFPGRIIDGVPSTLITGINESATAIDMAVPVARGTRGDGVKPFAADTDDVVGISIANPSQVAANPSDNVINYPRYADLPIGKIGHFSAIAAEDVRAGDQVIIVTAGANVNTTCWASSKGGVVGSGRVAYKGARWRSPPGAASEAIAAGTIAIIELIDQNLGRVTT